MKPKDRQKCEELFKQLQHANAQIGDESARKRYDLQSSSPFSSYNGFGGTGGMDRTTAEAFYRSYMQQQQQQQQRPSSAGRTPFYFNGVDISDLFPGNPFSKPTFWGGPLKSIYVQKVQVPLQDLYEGKQSVEFVLKDNLWKRYRAAIRGGIGKTIFFQALLFSIPIIRISTSMSVVVTAALFHSNIPRPVKLMYDCNIQKGWKSGTKLTFKEVEPGFDVVFILEEKKHGRYVRVGNDLHTTITIRKKQAKEGCVTEIEPLGAFDAPISLRLRPNQIKKSGEKVILRGGGWPRRQAGGYGDLVVTVNVQSNFSATTRPGATANKRTTPR